MENPADVDSKRKIAELPLKELQTMWNQQIDNLIAHKYHEALGKSEAEYRAVMPKVTVQPQEFKGRFDTPLLVDPRLDLKTQLHLMAIENDFDQEDLSLIVNAEGVHTPTVPYQLWIQLGQEYKGKTVDELMADMDNDERGLTVFEGIAFYREHQDLFTKDKSPYAKYSIGLAGSVDENPQFKGSIPQILYWMYPMGSMGEAEMWSHSKKQPNKSGGWPTTGIANR